MPNKSPKPGLKELSLYISKWVLLSEGSEEWIAEPQVLIIWHWFFVSTVAVIAVPVFIHLWVGSAIFQSVPAALCYRIVLTVGYLLSTALLAALIAKHYKYLLSTGKDLRFRNIVYFWIIWVFLFGQIYQSFYMIRPALFSCPIPLLQHSSVFVSLGFIVGNKMRIYFTVYSAATSVSNTVPFLSSASLIVSIFNVAEVLGTILMIGIVVATFVNKAGTTARNR
jgi:hypothetical protein